MTTSDALGRSRPAAARAGCRGAAPISEGRVEALVSGSRIYEVELEIDALGGADWQAIVGECAGQIDSLVELLEAKLSGAVMKVVTRRGQGLFPAPSAIELDCSCPDWAVMCKHVAATLYGVGARLDDEPELLFLLRGVDPADMIEEATARGVTPRGRARARTLTTGDLASIFGVDIDFGDEALRAAIPPAAAAAGLTGGARRVLALVTETPGLRAPQIAEHLASPPSTIRSRIAKLRKLGLVRFVGAPR